MKKFFSFFGVILNVVGIVFELIDVIMPSK